ncbi:MAG: hypothetical protein JWR38_4560 [Mucilaginibacter sp.]|nr:hypothetical protein [Mucilaginibacter sp.]
MKIRYFTTAVILFIYNLSGFAQVKELSQLVYTKQFTLLESALSVSKVSAGNKILYQAFLTNAFNQPAVSSRLVKKIFADKIAAKDDKLQFYLHRIAYDNYVKLNDYRSAHIGAEQLVKNYSSYFNAKELIDQKEENKIWSFLTDAPQQHVVKQASSIIPVKKDMAGLWNIPVQQQDSSYLFVFDTGANISTISATYA